MAKNNILQKAKSIALPTATIALAVASSTTLASDPATLPAGAEAAMTQISGYVDAFIAKAWPIVATIVGATIGIKLFKRFSNKAT